MGDRKRKGLLTPEEEKLAEIRGKIQAGYILTYEEQLILDAAEQPAVVAPRRLPLKQKATEILSSFPRAAAFSENSVFGRTSSFASIQPSSSSSSSFAGPGFNFSRQQSPGSAGVISAAARRAHPDHYQREVDAAAARLDTSRLRNVTCRNVIVFPGQLLPPEQFIDGNELPSPAWLVSLTQNVESLKTFLVNGIVPFELVDRIRYYIDPTEEHFARMRVQRRDEREAAGRQVTDMTSLLERLKEVTHGDPRRAGILNFSRVLGNFFTSVEAPDRIETCKIDCEFEGHKIVCPNSQGDEPNQTGQNKKQKVKSIAAEEEFADLQPAQLVTQLQTIINMAGKADDILREMGINARFAIWSPYGPGAAGLKRLFLIYDGVIEPHLAAQLSSNENVELVDALNIVTAAAGGGAIVADAVAVAHRGRTTQTVGARVLDQGAAASERQGDWEPATQIKLADGTVQSLLNIPVRDAYRAWYTALWVQSHLRHEERVSPDILAAHCRMIEFKLGYFRGTQFRHMPTFYQITLERPIRDFSNTICRYYENARRILNHTGQSISRGAEWVCNLAGVDTSVRIEGQSRLTEEELSRKARQEFSTSASASVQPIWDAIGEQRRGQIRGIHTSVGNSSRFVGNSFEQARENISSASASIRPRVEDWKQFVEPMAAAASRSAHRGVEAASRSAHQGMTVAKASSSRGATMAIAAVAGYSVGGAELAAVMMDLATATVPREIPGDIVGGGIALHCNSLQEGTPGPVMTVSPIVVLAGGGGGGGGREQVITTLDNAVAIGAVVNEEQVQAVVQGMLARLEQSQGRGLRGKKGPKRLTRRERKGIKGCKGTKKGCKGKKGKGKGIGRGNGTKKRGKRRGTSHKSMPPNDTMRIIQKLRNEINK